MAKKNNFDPECSSDCDADIYEGYKNYSIVKYIIV